MSKKNKQEEEVVGLPSAAQTKRQEVDQAYQEKVDKARREYQAGLQSIAKEYGPLDAKDAKLAEGFNDEYAWILQDEKDLPFDPALVNIDKYIDETMHGTPDVRVFIKKALRHFADSKSRVRELPEVPAVKVS